MCKESFQLSYVMSDEDLLKFVCLEYFFLSDFEEVHQLS